MKKSILIGIGLLILLLLGATWAYLFLYGAPQSTSEIFGTFRSEERQPSEGPVTDGIDEPQDPVNEADLPQLRQLTTRPVAGAIVIDDHMYFVERGTGHVYEIALPYGEEKLLSNTTIPQTVHAVWSPNGKHVAITAQRKETNETIVGSRTQKGELETLEGVSLPAGSSNVGWSAEGDVLFYLLRSPRGSRGYRYNPVTRESSQLFEIPLRDVHIQWGDRTIAYTTPSARQTGYVYEVQEGLSYVTGGGPGLMALTHKDDILVTKLVDGTLVTTAPISSEELPLPLYPEKCISSASYLYCAAPTGYSPGEYPDDWYKGEASFNDALWKIDVEMGEASLLSPMSSVTGIEIDATNIGISRNNEYIYFVNKNDGALWLFENSSL